MKEAYDGLPMHKISDAVEIAKLLIEEEASGVQTGLYSRFNPLNIAMLKYFRFGLFTLIAGRSGGGKSLLLNMLRNDFSNGLIDLTKTNKRIDLGEISILKPTGETFYLQSGITKLTTGKYVIKPLNHKCIHDIVILHFGYEMSSTDELLRTTSTIIGKSYSYLLSSEYNKDKFNGYNKLSANEKLEISEILDCIGQRKEYYVPISGNIAQMEATVNYVRESNPDKKLIVTLDHSLLTRKSNENGTEELVNNLAKFGADLSEEGAMVIFLHQLNNLIEDGERIRNKLKHYPSKPDIHWGAQLWWAVDNVIVIHIPKQLKILRYGVDELYTDDLVHLAIIKQRFGEPGNVWLKEQLSKGRLYEAKHDDFLKNPSVNVALPIV